MHGHENCGREGKHSHSYDKRCHERESENNEHEKSRNDEHEHCHGHEYENHEHESNEHEKSRGDEHDHCNSHEDENYERECKHSRSDDEHCSSRESENNEHEKSRSDEHENCHGHENENHEHESNKHEKSRGDEHDHDNCCDHHLYDEDGLAPTVCSLLIDIPHGFYNKKENGNEYEEISERIRSLRDWAKQQGFFVGHIKAVVSETDHIVWFSCTGGDVQIQKGMRGGAKSGITAIIYGPDETELSETMKRIFCGL